MSAIRGYLEEKAALPEKEWLRREPRSTHPDILEAVRTFRMAGGTYDADAERFVCHIAGDLPEWTRHGTENRDRLILQLGHEAYIAKEMLADEQSRRRAAELRAEGFVALHEAREGKVYDVLSAVTYCGQLEPSYGKPRRGRCVGFAANGSPIFLPPRARTNGFTTDHPGALVREVSS